jgi:hypothetical protein
VNTLELKTDQKKARLASLDELVRNVLPGFISPVPCKPTLRKWFDSAKIPRLKTGLTARRGGGEVFFSVAHVERFFQARTLPPISK